jgi:Putative beta-barrel porin-2, OmpL-like. bbp2
VAYLVADAINDGKWGYNNLQWTGITWYHTFDEHWHFSWETYTLGQTNVLNAADPAHIIANSGWPFSVQNGFKFNAPNFAQCSSPYVVTCNARVFTSVMYVNYRFSGLDNLSFRGEFYDDMQGQRTGTKTRYYEFGIGVQHWLSPQVEFRPEVTYYHSMDANAFNGNFNAVNPSGAPIAPDRDYALVAASRASRAVLRNMLRDEGFEQVLDAVGHHPLPSIMFLGGEITSLQPGGKHLLRRHPSLVKGHPTVGPDGIFSQPGTSTSGSVQDDKDFPARRSYLYTEARAGSIPIDDVFAGRRQVIDHALGQLHARHLIRP